MAMLMILWAALWDDVNLLPQEKPGISISSLTLLAEEPFFKFC